MYSNFAYVYDKLMYDIDYKEWVSYLESIFKLNGIKPSTILDLGCGTGSICIEMAKRGYDMIGLDISEDMLACAQKKSSDEGVQVLYLNQNMTDFELYGTVDVIVCLMDSINYITDKKEILKLFKLVENYLNPEGLFIFDVNTPYKLEHVLGGNVFYDVSDELSYIWENRFDKRKGICEFDLTFFIKKGLHYDRYDEVHYERSFSDMEVKKMINNTNMILLNAYNALKFTLPTKKSERIFYICKKLPILL